MTDKKKDPQPSAADLSTRVSELEKLVSDLQKLLKSLPNRLQFLLAKKYPQITGVSSGQIVTCQQDLNLLVNANVRGTNLYEVAIINEDGSAAGNSIVVTVSFQSDGMGGYMNPSTQVTITSAMLQTLAPETEYILICRKYGGGSDSNLIEHKVAIVTNTSCGS